MLFGNDKLEKRIRSIDIFFIRICGGLLFQVVGGVRIYRTQIRKGKAILVIVDRLFVLIDEL